MSCRLILIIIFCLSAFLASAQGKWHGDFSIDGATNFNFTSKNKNTHNLGDISAKVGYETDIFNVYVTTGASYKHLITKQTGKEINLDGTESLKAVDVSASEFTGGTGNARLDLGWKLNTYNTFSAYYSYDYSRDRPDNYTMSASEIEMEKKSFDYSFSKENADNWSGVHNAGLYYIRTFNKPGRELSADLTGMFLKNEQFSDWQTGDGSKNLASELTKNQYRITPFSSASAVTAAVRYTDPNFAGVRNLDLKFVLKWDFKNIEDHSRASTLIDGEWRDSVSYRENFKFQSSTLLPVAGLRYSVKFYELDLNYSPEYYLRKLDSDNKIGDVDRGAVAHLVNLVNTFTIKKEHKIVVSFNRNEDRPTYLQVCWFPRSTKYSDEVRTGNPDLENSTTLAGMLAYNFERKRFSTTFALNYVYQPNKIAETYSNDTSSTGSVYRVYTWVNGERSREMNANLIVSWKGEHLKANIVGKYTYYRGLSLSDEETRSSDYSVGGDIEYCIKNWTFAAAISYQSDIIRSYTSITGIPACDVRISKEFKEHFTLWIEGRGLLDQTIEKTTMSEDETTVRKEEITNHNRLFALGFNYHF